ncbi:MAG: DUF853 family protein [Anaerolineales bacterium]|nr:DUF853 family protein [Anaerolineales bacterium]
MTDKFYLGRQYDAQGQPLDRPLLYDPADLTTHAVVTGMTGSGKTGLCIAILEEAALQGVPALLIDPKGDLTNLLLHFPDLAPQDFQPWLDPEMARRAGKSLEQVAVDTAGAWKQGLGEWGIDRQRLMALKNAVQFGVYTPGSDAGIPVSVLTSLAAPGLDWAGNREVLTERIASTVTALLGLAGLNDVDPIQSREHILLANIFQFAWSQNRSLDLTELILQIQNPPFEKLGAFPVDTFFPAKQRMALALQLNNILASPSFELWKVGQPLEIGALLWTPDGRPRHSVFTLSHLSDPDRMFFVTLLLSAVETWMRTQTGATNLRALLYMDEIYGYMPPLRNPSSKQPLLRMLKQARAFGLGLILATQNPVDVDYKGLSNAGTWFIGKLQTEQDKQRLLDGLQGAVPSGLDRSSYDKLISALGKRMFLMHNVHAKQPTVFQTRWAMNFLAGPLTRAQIPALNKLVGADTLQAFLAEPPGAGAGASEAPEGFTPIARPASTGTPASPPPADRLFSLTRPPVPAGMEEFFLPMNLSFTRALAAAGEPVEGLQLGGVLYRPAILAAAQVRFQDRKYGLDSEAIRSALVVDPDRRGVVRWDEVDSSLPLPAEMDPGPAPEARFAGLDAPFTEARLMAALEKDYRDWIYRTSKITVRVNEALGLYATPDVSQAEFMKACSDAARQARDAEMARVTASFDKQIQTIENRIAREERELKMDESELSQRKGEEIATHAENVLGVFGGGRRSRRLSTSLTKRRMTEQAKADVEESVEALEQYDQQLGDLEQARQRALDELGDRWGDVVNDITEVSVTPKKADIFLDRFGLAWMPYYLAEAGAKTIEVPAYRG